MMSPVSASLHLDDNKETSNTTVRINKGPVTLENGAVYTGQWLEN